MAKKVAKKVSKKKATKKVVKKKTKKVVKKKPVLKKVVLETRHGFTLLDKVKLVEGSEYAGAMGNPLENQVGVIFGFGAMPGSDKDYDILVAWPDKLNVNEYQAKDLVKV